MKIETRDINNFNVELTSRARVAGDAFKLEFRLIDSQILFEAGQYIWLKIPKLSYPDPRGDRRAFSIVSDPQKKDSVTIITKKSESGFKKTLLKLPVGSLFEITGPFGSFTLHEDRLKSPIYFVAGGTGVSPFLSMIESRSHSGSGPQIYLIYSEATEKNFLPEALAMIEKSEYKNFLKVFLNTGRLRWSFIKRNVEINKNGLWYFSGPKEMVKSLSLLALKNGITRDQMVFDEHYPVFVLEGILDSLDKDIYKLAIENSLVHIVITDVNGRILYANKAATEITGYSAEEMLGNTPRIWGGLMNPAFYKDMWHTVKFDRKPFIGKVKNRKKSGEYYIAELSIAPIISKSKKLLGFSVSEKDITELERIDQSKTEFISLAAHQLKNPPTAIKWITETLFDEKTGKLTEKQREYLNDAHFKNEQMINLINALLDVSRMELGLFTIKNPISIDINLLVQNIIKDLRIRITEKDLRLTERYAKEKLVIFTDSNLLQMVFQNLITNAINYTPKKGEITIEISAKRKGEKFGGRIVTEDSAVFMIADTGCGIPKQQQSKIFTKLFRADNVREKYTDGTGLGLYIVKFIVDEFGGAIWFVSEENKGTTFYVVIPLSGTKAQNEEKQLTS